MAIQGCRAAHNWCSKANLLGVGGGLPDDRRSSVNTFMINPLRENIGPGGCTGPGWTRGAPAHGCYAPQHIFLRRCSKYVLGALFLERFLPNLGRRFAGGPFSCHQHAPPVPCMAQRAEAPCRAARDEDPARCAAEPGPALVLVRRQDAEVPHQRCTAGAAAPRAGRTAPTPCWRRPCRAPPARRPGARSAPGTASTIRSRARPRGRR